MELNRIYNENCITGLRKVPDGSIDCTVTSPPYFALRDYGYAEQLGLEDSPEEYVKSLMPVFQEVYRVTKPAGTLWLNLGDSYWGGKGKSGANSPEYFENRTSPTMAKLQHCIGKKGWIKPGDGKHEVIKAKDLVGIPWRMAFALQGFAIVPFHSFTQWADILRQARETKDWTLVSFVEGLLRKLDILAELQRMGWYLRQDIIWSKPNPMPESVRDRCTKSHEYIFMFAKSEKYYFDADSIKTEGLNPIDDIKRKERVSPDNKSNPDNLKNGIRHKNLEAKRQQLNSLHKSRAEGKEWENEGGKANKRSVWTVTTKPYAEAHFATFPEDLIVDCIKAGCPEFICITCGKPREKIIEKKYITHNNWYGDKTSASKTSRGKQGKAYREIVDEQITGLTDCNCGVGFSSGTVLDPFGGAGTTAIVSRKLNRNFILFELNPDYIKIAEERLHKQIGLFL